MDQFAAWAALAERSAANYVHPGFDFENRATKDWPLTKLDQALYVVAAYSVLVVFGLVVRSFSSSKVASAEKEGKQTVAQSFAAEPIKYLVVVYNAVQVALCAWMAAAAFYGAYKQNYSLLCNPFITRSTAIASVLWVFYLSKVLDFFDTVFIIARGKWDQFSFLHVYHHFSIFLVYWAVTVYGYDGDVYYTIIANSIVHFFMYLYYFLTCFNIRPSWGKNLTQLQMLQFLTMNAQAIYIIFASCYYPVPLTKFYLGYILSLFALFMQFYLQRWSGGGKGKGKKAKSTEASKSQ